MLGLYSSENVTSRCERETLLLLLLAQVSWSLPHKQASSGTYQVKFFDEESYSALRKVTDCWDELGWAGMSCIGWDELYWLWCCLKQQQLCIVNDCNPSSPGPEKQWRCKCHWATLLRQHWPQGEFLMGPFSHIHVCKQMWRPVFLICFLILDNSLRYLIWSIFLLKVLVMAWFFGHLIVVVLLLWSMESFLPLGGDTGYFSHI